MSRAELIAEIASLIRGREEGKVIALFKYHLSTIKFSEMRKEELEKAKALLEKEIQENKL